MDKVARKASFRAPIDAKQEQMELDKQAHAFKRIMSVSMAEEALNMDLKEHLKKEVEETTTSAFANIGRWTLNAYGPMQD